MFFTLLIAFMTAFYMFRLCFLTFTGKPRSQERFDHAHESPKTMTVPLMVLAFLSVFAGWVGLPWLSHGFSSFVYHGELHHHSPSYILMVVSTIVAVSGIGLAYTIYYKNKISADSLMEKFKPLYTLLYNKYFIDEIYDKIIIKPTLALTRGMWWYDANIIDGLVNFSGWITIKWADAKMWFDKYIVDGAVNGAGYLCMAGAWLLKFVQSGSVQFYALVIIAGSVGVIIYRVTPEGVIYYLIGVLIVALARYLLRINRPAEVSVKTEPEG
jgi:NADH-quinone oxidoreductase subunit L